MPFLDAIHLLLETCATIEDEASVFGKEWRMTLEYVLHQHGLEMAYTSRLNDQHDVWVFLGTFCVSLIRLLVVADVLTSMGD